MVVVGIEIPDAEDVSHPEELLTPHHEEVPPLFTEEDSSSFKSTGGGITGISGAIVSESSDFDSDLSLDFLCFEITFLTSSKILSFCSELPVSDWNRTFIFSVLSETISLISLIT